MFTPTEKDILDYIKSCPSLRSHWDRIDKRLEMHAYAGQYDPNRAPRAYKKLVDRACRLYCREAGKLVQNLRPWHVLFSPPVRNLACSALVALFVANLKSL